MNKNSQSTIRIGTWNLDGKWSDGHRALIDKEHCDVWLLTEVNPKSCSAQNRIGAYNCHLSEGVMPRQQHWAAILSLENLQALPDPHTASAAARINGITYCSSILPWAACGSGPPTPWIGNTLKERTSAAIAPIEKMLPPSMSVWGGDWNQNLFGGWQYVGSSDMQVVIESAVTYLGLRVETDELPHRLPGSNTIDHIAVPTQWIDPIAERIPAPGLSDHDAYIIEAHRIDPESHPDTKKPQGGEPKGHSLRSDRSI